jgi:hypothetical protein
MEKVKHLLDYNLENSKTLKDYTKTELSFFMNKIRKHELQ